MIHKSWQPLFDQYEFDLDDIYDGEVYPPREKIFRAFSIPVDQIQVVLLGQDPYHGPGQADGLSFSVPSGTAIPPSLLNIFKELKQSFPERNYSFPSGNLDEWLTREKIFLCNASLTVEKGKAGSHMDLWKDFTDEMIQYIDTHNRSCVFLLLGNFAKSKAPLITKKDRIVTEVHPSPLARGFIGSNVFQRVEKVLGRRINWSTQSTVDSLCSNLEMLSLDSKKQPAPDVDMLCERLESLTVDPYKKVIYLDCDPKVLGTNKIAVTLDYSPPESYTPPPKPKLTRLERMCQDPQTVGEQAVQAYVEYSKLKNLPIKIEDINDILSST